MYAPSGGVTASTASRKRAICSQPFRVMSELLRFEQRNRQVDEESKRHQQSCHMVGGHAPPPLSRSHATTYPMLTMKKRMVAVTKIRSSIASPGSRRGNRVSNSGYRRPHTKRLKGR